MSNNNHDPLRGKPKIEVSIKGYGDTSEELKASVRDMTEKLYQNKNVSIDLGKPIMRVSAESDIQKKVYVDIKG